MAPVVSWITHKSKFRTKEWVEMEAWVAFAAEECHSSKLGVMGDNGGNGRSFRFYP